jgi:hypothetical protein
MVKILFEVFDSEIADCDAGDEALLGYGFLNLTERLLALTIRVLCWRSDSSTKKS